MSEVNRRGVVRLAAALAVGAVAMPAAGQGPTDSPTEDRDESLARAIENPSSYMLGKPVVVRLGGDSHTRDLVITSARDVDLKPTTVRLKPGKVAIFRADADVDDFTKEGRLRWQFFGKSGECKLATPGAIVMVVHDWDDTIRCYTMTLDFRC